MNPPKCTNEDYINFIIAIPRGVTATELDCVAPDTTNDVVHDAFTRLLQRLEPDSNTLLEEAKTQIEFSSGLLVLDDSTLDKPYSPRTAFQFPASSI